MAYQTQSRQTAANEQRATGGAALADQRPQATAQRLRQQMMAESPRASAQRSLNLALASAPVQRKRFNPAGATYVNKTSEDVWLGENTQQKGHLFTRAAGKKDDRGALMTSLATLAEPVGAAVTGKTWVTSSGNYDKPGVGNKIDPFRLRLSGTYDDDNKVLATDYHFGPYNLGYVVRVNDRGSIANMASRVQLNDATLGATATYSNRHHALGNQNLLADSDNVGTTRTHSEMSFDSSTKMTGEGARFNCVKNHIANLADSTRFFTHTASHDRAAYWVPFDKLWLTWSATFGKAFGIADASVKAEVVGNTLKKLGNIGVPRGSGPVSGLTAGRDYNLDRSRAATENDRHKLIDLTITDDTEAEDLARQGQIQTALDNCDEVVYVPTMDGGGKSWSVTVWADGGTEAVKAVMPDETTVDVD